MVAAPMPDWRRRVTIIRGTRTRRIGSRRRARQAPTAVAAMIRPSTPVTRRWLYSTIVSKA
jgi:hypothetical protein